MWGNLRGWLIAAALAALCCAWLYFLAHASEVTPPTAFSAGDNNFTAIMLPKPPAILLMSDVPDIDTADLYRKAIQAFESNPGVYENFASLGTLDSPTASKLAAIDLLVKAAAAENAPIFAPHAEELLNFSHTKPPLDALRVLGHVCVDRLALLNQKINNTGYAMRYYQAGFALGHNLCTERLTYDEFQLGEELISKTTAGMASLLDQSGQADSAAIVRSYAKSQLIEIQKHVDPVVGVVRGVDPKAVSEHAGDVCELALRSHEPMWRVEAIFAVARLRYFAGQRGAADQRVATQMLGRLAADETNPIVRSAATIGRDLTIEQYRSQ